LQNKINELALFYLPSINKTVLILKKHIFTYILLFALLFCFGLQEGSAQFYNGHQMSFGKSRVQFKERFHRFYRFPNYDVYFYAGGEDMSKRIAEIAEEEISNAEAFFGRAFDNRLIFIAYKKLSDFRGSNIGYDTQNENSNIGGTTKIINNKVLIFYEGEQELMEKQIRAGIVRALINEMLYGGNYRQRVTNSTLLTLPEWYIEGLVSYLSEEWNTEIENIVKDGFESGRYKKINHLTGDEAAYAGHSFWYFLAETYGHTIIPNILYVTRLNKNTDAGFKSLLGLSVRDLSPEWKEFYNKRFEHVRGHTENLADESLLKGKRQRLWRELKSDKNNRYISYISHKKGRYTIYLYDTETEKRKKIRRKGHPLDQITDYSQPVTAWHPSGNIFSFIAEEQGELFLYTYNLKEKEKSRRRIAYFDKILSYEFSADGLGFVFSGVKNGATNIYVYSLPANNYQQITDDIADDLYPTFAQGGNKIIFSSNRKDTLRSSLPTEGLKNYDLFEYDLKKRSETLRRITHTPFDNETYPDEYEKHEYLTISDHNGLKNRYVVKFDSTISSVDTVVHYRYFSKQEPLTNYNRNIENYSFSKRNKNLYELLYKDNRYRVFESYLDLNSTPDELYITQYKKNQREEYFYRDSLRREAERAEEIRQARIDSLRENPPEDLAHPDSAKIDINSYIFETERYTDYYNIHPIEDSMFTESPEEEAFIETRNYKTNFYTNHMTQQVDFGLLNNSYQAFTGNAYYFNPGVNIFTKVGAYDLLEDYRITGGFRIGTDFESYEYLLSFEDIKGRLDKQYIYHRQTQVQTYYDDYGFPHYFKIFSNQGMYVLKYPFNQVAAVRGTFSLRHDKGLWQSNDYNTLISPIQNQAFAGIKGEYIFDNTRNLGVNLYEGSRFKVFGEFYQEIGEEMVMQNTTDEPEIYTNFAVLGFDFRVYKKIHRTLIFASRMGASTSLGKSKLLYYLGGVDNWYTISPDKKMFDETVNINYEENYVYQAVGTNMRGFIQNARNGNTFFVINNEIRFPVIRYLANRPLNSDFLNTFQVVGFADAGAAWSGKSPYDEKNKYLTETVRSGPITVIIDKNRWPVIFGYGVGLRSRVFGYFVRLDWAWGIDNDHVRDRVFYFSLNLDF
jgi:hypothetical protein